MFALNENRLYRMGFSSQEHMHTHKSLTVHPRSVVIVVVATEVR